MRAAILVWLIVLAAAASSGMAAAKQTVCTITVNSADEKKAFQRHLRSDEYEFVELLERGRSDWLDSACRRHVSCDVLIISGHFNGAEFYSASVDIDDFLPIQEMERASCSASCPALFSHVKEVYMFGCDTLNPQTIPSVAAEIERSLERSGRSPAEAARTAQTLAARHAQSIREAARRLFLNVPAIYGFSAHAPLGPTAAALIDRYFQSSPGARIGSGTPSRQLLASFAANSMTVVPGFTSADAQARDRAQACRFVDDRQSPAQKLAFIHELLRIDPAEGRVFLDEIEGFVSTLNQSERQQQETAAALDDVAQDRDTRSRFLQFARDADQPVVRVRMIGVAHALGWLSAEERRAELRQLVEELLARPSLAASDVDTICSLDDDVSLGDANASLQSVERVDHAAALACMGSREDHQRMLRALTSSSADDMRMAEVYFRHRPIADRRELQEAAAAIARMSASELQARAIEILGQHRLSDGESLEALTRLFPLARSIDVQRAIAGLIIRADYHAIATPETVRMLRQSRLKSSGGEDIIDILIRRLGARSEG